MLMPDYGGCIYAATNVINGRRYIGKTKMRLTRRITCHKAVAARGRGQVFHAALRKYGFDAFTWDVLFVSSDEDALYAAERQIISDARASGELLYNRSDGGEGATGLFWSPAKRMQLSSTLKGRRKPEETRRKLSEAHKGKRKSPEHVEHMRLSRIGKTIAPWTAERRAKMEATWERKRSAGVGHSKEARQRMSEAAKRRCNRPDERERLSVVGRKGARVRWGG
jgi:group I intron endonuclease